MCETNSRDGKPEIREVDWDWRDEGIAELLRSGFLSGEPVEMTKAELLAMPEEELRPLYRRVQAERRRRLLGLNLNMPQGEELSFYDPRHEVDFAHWSRMAHWRIEEGAALLCGCDPNELTWKKAELHAKSSTLGATFAKVLDYARRAADVGDSGMKPQTAPADFLRWALNSGITVPAELRELVRDRTGELSDSLSQIIDLQEKLEDAKAQISRLQASLLRAENGGDELTTGNKNSVYTLLLGLWELHTKKEYDLNAGKNSQHATILKAIRRRGFLKINDPDTVAKHLKDAARFLEYPEVQRNEKAWEKQRIN